MGAVKGPIYISGPMTGYVRDNYPSFADAADRLRRDGWVVLNPAENFGGRADLPRQLYMHLDIAMVSISTHVLLLKGWSRSRGARLEKTLAEDLGLEIVYDAGAELDVEHA